MTLTIDGPFVLWAMLIFGALTVICWWQVFRNPPSDHWDMWSVAGCVGLLILLGLGIAWGQVK